MRILLLRRRSLPARAVRHSDVQSLAQRIVAEFLGTAFLLAAVVGSGIMAAGGIKGGIRRLDSTGDDQERLIHQKYNPPFTLRVCAVM